MVGKKNGRKNSKQTNGNSLQKNEKSQFNVIISGVGGQGVMTLGSLLALTAMKEGNNVYTSELHGLAKRFGHTEFHFRMGDVNTTIVPNKSADLIIALEPLETLQLVKYCDKERTVVYVDNIMIKPTRMDIEGINYPDLDEIKAKIKPHVKDFIVINASDESKKITGSNIFSNVYILGKIVSNKHINIKSSTIIEVLEESFGKDNVNVIVLKEAMKK